MSCATCGCATQPCGCCEGVQVLTPLAIYNRPGLPVLSWRVGTHSSFLQTMQARLSTMEVDGLGVDGQPLSHLRPLQGLTTRDPGDPTIALLDAWATVSDVLGFYQERNANEAYLRTATERRSVLELARGVGYTLRPGVAATAYLAYTLDANQAEPVTIPTGARSQSVPDPDETAQAFETSEDLVARREWNNLQVRLQQPQNITLDNVLSIPAMQVAGTATNLKPGDKLLLVFNDKASTSAIRVVEGLDTQFADQRTSIQLRPIDPVLLSCTTLLLEFARQLAEQVADGASGATKNVLDKGEEILGEVYLGWPVDPDEWAEALTRQSEGGDDALVASIGDFGTAITAITHPEAEPSGNLAVTDSAAFALALLKPAVVQVRNSLQLPRSLSRSFLPARTSNPTGGLVVGRARGLAAASATAPIYADAATQLLVSFVPTVKRTYYTAWAGAQLNPTPAALQTVCAMRSRASLFGATASKLPTYTDGTDPANIPAGVLKPPNLWSDWTFKDAPDEKKDNAFLDQANENVTAGGYAVLELDGKRAVFRIAEATTMPRTAYGLSGQTTRLVFDTPNDEGWRSVDPATDITQLRNIKLYVQSDPLKLVDAPITTPIDMLEITLDGLYDGLTSGRWVVLSGERTDIDHVDGVRYAELQMVSGVSHSYDPQLPGDQVHTTLTLATDLAYAYKRKTLTIYGNVVKATHGETRNEVLGSGDGAQALQSFTLNQPPLTFVAAPTAAGAQSTLSVRVNGVEWQEAATLAGLGAKDRRFVTLTDDTGLTSLVFGNGARLPTGVQNVRAVYRNGIGQPGNVKAGQIKLLQTRPLGVKEVINPLRASGGADKETRDLARENAPLSVMALDRLVSVPDYADFTRRFAGIAKASALTVSDGRRQLVYLTIAGVDDIPIDTTSDLYQNLLTALRAAGAPDLPLRVDVREVKALVLSANLKLLPDFEWEPVVAAARAQLLDRFGFARRELGQPALLCEVIAAIQQVRGIAYVDVDAFGAVPQTVADVPATTPPTRHFLTQDDIVQAVDRIVTPPLTKGPASAERLPPDVDAWPGGSDQGLLRPAELAVFVPGVADTLVLNQIP